MVVTLASMRIATNGFRNSKTQSMEEFEGARERLSRVVDGLKVEGARKNAQEGPGKGALSFGLALLGRGWICREYAVLGNVSQEVDLWLAKGMAEDLLSDSRRLAADSAGGLETMVAGTSVPRAMKTLCLTLSQLGDGKGARRVADEVFEIEESNANGKRIVLRDVELDAFMSWKEGRLVDMVERQAREFGLEAVFGKKGALSLREADKGRGWGPLRAALKEARAEVEKRLFAETSAYDTASPETVARREREDSQRTLPKAGGAGRGVAGGRSL